MKWLTLPLLLVSIGGILGVQFAASGGETAIPHRSPNDLAVLPGGQYLLTANHTADSVSLVDVNRGQVLVEQPVGRKPVAVACSRDGKRAAVSNLWSGTVSLLEIDGSTIRRAGEIAVGALPRGLAFAADGNTLYVAVAGQDEIAVLDWSRRHVRQRWTAPREPWSLALSADGRLLAACSTRSGQVRCWDTQSQQLRWERSLFYSFHLRGLTFSPDGKDLACAFVYNRERPLTQNNIGEGWALDNRVARLPIEADKHSEIWQMALDLRGEAVGDPHGVAYSPDGRWLVVTGSGTHELLIFEPGHIPWSPGEPGDFADIALEVGPHKMRRVPLGGRPLNVAFLDSGRTVAVVNYLRDAVQIVDVEKASLVRTIPLGGPVQPDLARQGEVIFYDAQRSHHQWFSCHTCHSEGHTNGQLFDTNNDESYGNPKLTPSLWNVVKTGPWTWHGWQNSLEDSLVHSLTETLFGAKPQAADVKALAAFLATLQPPPNPHRAADGSLSAAAQRGKIVFEGKAHCNRCHKGELYTTSSNFDLKLGYDGSPHELWNPPTLLGVWNRGPYMHDGRAATLDELLRSHHVPEKLGGQQLTDEERRDLIEFLKAL